MRYFFDVRLIAPRCFVDCARCTSCRRDCLVMGGRGQKLALARTALPLRTKVMKFLDPYSMLRSLQGEGASGKNSVGGDADGSTVAYGRAN